MKRIIATIVILLAGMMAAPMAFADPTSTFTATHPTQYEDGTVIPSTDILTFTINCGNTAAGPYLFTYPVASLESGTVIDVSSCVQGTPGVYYFVATAISGTFSTESIFSNESVRTYTASDLGKTPLAPTLLIIS